MKKLYILIILFIFCIITGCDDVTVPPNTETDAEKTTISDTTDITEDNVLRAINLDFIYDDGKYIYASDKNNIFRFTQDLTEKETIYSRIYDLDEYIDSFLFADENTLLIRLMDYPVEPHDWFIEVNLLEGTSEPLYEESGTYKFGLPTKIEDSIYYSKCLKTDFHWNNMSVMKKSKDSEDVEILKHIRDWDYYDSHFYYITSDKDGLYRCDLNGDSVEKVFDYDNIGAFKIYNNKIYYNYLHSSNVLVYDIKTNKIYEIPTKFYLSTAKFNRGFMYVRDDNWKSYRIDTKNYSVEDFNLEKSFPNTTSELIKEVNEYFSQEYIYYRQILYNDYVEKIEIYRQNLDNGVVSNVIT